MMTKAEAAEIIANDVRVWARNAGRSEVTLSLCEERVSELRGETHQGTFKGDAAAVAHPKTVLRAARRWPL